VGAHAPRRQLKNVHKKSKQVQWPQHSDQALAGALGPLVAGCWGEGKEGQLQPQLQLQQLIKDGAVGFPASRRQPKGVHKEDKQLQWPQFSDQALAGALGPLVVGCWGKGKEGQKQL